jgi:hypothetical protein
VKQFRDLNAQAAFENVEWRLVEQVAHDRLRDLGIAALAERASRGGGKNRYPFLGVTVGVRQIWQSLAIRGDCWHPFYRWRAKWLI